MSSRFYPHDAVTTDAVLSLDEDSVLSTNEVSRWLKNSKILKAQKPNDLGGVRTNSRPFHNVALTLTLTL